MKDVIIDFVEWYLRQGYDAFELYDDYENIIDGYIEEYYNT